MPREVPDAQGWGCPSALLLAGVVGLGQLPGVPIGHPADRTDVSSTPLLEETPFLGVCEVVPALPQLGEPCRG